MEKILIIDDDKLNSHLLQQYLSDRYDVSVLWDGTHALSTALKLKPDIILLDIQMPEILFATE